MAVDLKAPIDPATFTIGATHVNRFQVLASVGGLVRIAFGEVSPEGAVFYRTALVMTFADAKDLSEVITGILQRSTQPAQTEKSGS